MVVFTVHSPGTPSRVSRAIRSAMRSGWKNCKLFLAHLSRSCGQVTRDFKFIVNEENKLVSLPKQRFEPQPAGASGEQSVWSIEKSADTVSIPNHSSFIAIDGLSAATVSARVTVAFRRPYTTVCRRPYHQK